VAGVDEALVGRRLDDAALRLWSESDWEFAFDTAALKAKFHAEPASALATEMRNREKVLGTTADFRRDLRIRYVDPAAQKVPAR
jgi:hypothetical protein